MAKKIVMEIFRAGKQIDSSGNSKEWTEKDLDTIVSKFNETDKDGNRINTVPATLGHPTDDAPAWGWFTKMFREGKSLFAELGEQTDELALMLKKKMFKNRSIALRADLSPRHVAFLGAAAPAVKGLEALSFTDPSQFIIKGIKYLTFADKSEDLTFGAEIEFTEDSFKFGMIGDLFQKMRDLIIADKGLEKADDMIQQWRIDSIKREPSPPIQDFIEHKKPGQKPTKKGVTMPTLEETQAELATANETITAFEAEKVTFSESDTKKDAEIKGLKDKIEATEKETLENQYSEIVDKAIAGKHILPANRENHINMLRVLHGQEAIDFTEGDKTVKKTPFQAYKESIENSDISGMFNEFATKGATPEAEKQTKLDNAINTFMEKNEGSTYGDATRSLDKSNPELFEGVQTVE